MISNVNTSNTRHRLKYSILHHHSTYNNHNHVHIMGAHSVSSYNNHVMDNFYDKKIIGLVDLETGSQIFIALWA